MSNRIKLLEDNLNVILPQAYRSFINETGIISDERGEVYGYIEGIDINKIPCVIGATKLYKQNYLNISSKDIVIAFDDFNNTPIVIAFYTSFKGVNPVFKGFCKFRKYIF